MGRLETLREELAREKENLAAYEKARLDIVTTGVQSYSLRMGDDQRQVENISLSQLNALIESTRKRISTLEWRVDHGGSTGMVAVIGGRM